MKKTKTLAAFLVVAAFFGTGCDSVSTETDEGIVVEAYLEAGAEMGEVRLSRTIGIGDRYDFASAAIRDAQVEIRRLGPDGVIEDVIEYTALPDRPGVYATASAVTVRPLTTYELFVTVPSTGETIRSRTIVPGLFEVVEAGPEMVEYQGNEQIEVVLTRSFYPGRNAIFVFSTESLDPHIDTLTPFYREVVEPDTDADEDELEDYLINESPPLNEAGYQIDEEGYLRIKVPWLAFAFYGPNRLRTNAIDDNLYDFVRSQSIQQGGTTLAPGEIPNVIDHVEGGFGVFGSYARASIEVNVVRNPSL